MVSPLAPQASASANFATPARGAAGAWARRVGDRRNPPESGQAFHFAIASTAANSAAVTGWTESRLPFLVTTISASAGLAFSSFSVITRANFRTNATSTATQRGASFGEPGSWYSDFLSNCVGSGYAARATLATPATPAGSALEW